MGVTRELRVPALPVLAMRLAGARASSWFRQAATALGLRRRAEYELADLELPDSEIARHATELVCEASPAFLANHCVRTYLFGAALGMRDGLRFDHEVLYLGAIMHDLGFTDRCEGIEPFELEGARAARSMLLARSYPRQRADLVHEAIALHTSIGVAAMRQPEIALVQAGSGCDVVGLRFEDLSRRTVSNILMAHPRLGMKEALLAIAEPKIRGKKDCPLGALMRLGFAGFVRRAPYSE